MTSFCRFFDWTISKTFCNIIFEAMMKRAQKFTFEAKFFSSSDNTITVWTWFISFRNSIYSSCESKWFDSSTSFSSSAIFNWWSWSTTWNLRCNFHRCRFSNNNSRSFWTFIIIESTFICRRTNIDLTWTLKTFQYQMTIVTSRCCANHSVWNTESNDFEIFATTLNWFFLFFIHLCWLEMQIPSVSKWNSIIRCESRTN